MKIIVYIVNLHLTRTLPFLPSPPPSLEIHKYMYVCLYMYIQCVHINIQIKTVLKTQPFLREHKHFICISLLRTLEFWLGFFCGFFWMVEFFPRLLKSLYTHISHMSAVGLLMILYPFLKPFLKSQATDMGGINKNYRSM